MFMPTYHKNPQMTCIQCYLLFSLPSRAWISWLHSHKLQDSVSMFLLLMIISLSGWKLSPWGVSNHHMLKFYLQKIIARFGMPQSIIFDSEPQFECSNLTSWLERTRDSRVLCLSCSSPSHWEAFNKTITSGIKKKSDQTMGLWPEELYNI